MLLFCGMQVNRYILFFAHFQGFFLLKYTSCVRFQGVVETKLFHRLPPLASFTNIVKYFITYLPIHFHFFFTNGLSFICYGQ